MATLGLATMDLDVQKLTDIGIQETITTAKPKRATQLQALLQSPARTCWHFQINFMANC